ncbi:MAG: hypothetical protein NW203_06690 [Hyphomonadaceae bacterium]|nr:hypothetical protein [Hyphomonadaceae bacterium]
MAFRFSFRPDGARPGGARFRTNPLLAAVAAFAGVRALVFATVQATGEATKIGVAGGAPL